jgi:hypothetical protein
MSQDIAGIETKYQLFIEQSTASKLVWGLKNKNGWANTHSSSSEEVNVIPFWSDKAYAKAGAKDDWKGYLPVPIPLAEFLESWCVDMANDGILAGINWDANMFGKEIDALNVVLDILNQLNSTLSAISFLNYGSINEFMADINESVD